MEVVRRAASAWILAGLLLFPRVKAQVIEFENRGLKYQTLTRNGVTIMFAPLATRVRSYAAAPLLHEPESKYLYSNAGINTAGRIIEVASGMKYEDFLAKRLFQPLGMKDTTFWPNAEQIGRIAKSYRGNKDKSDIEETKVGQLLYPLDDRVHREPMPAGGLFSTAADVARSSCRRPARSGSPTIWTWVVQNRSVLSMAQDMPSPRVGMMMRALPT